MLPFLVIAPAKPAVMFNLGVLCILVAFGIQRGFKEFFINQFFCGERPRNFIAIAWMIILFAVLIFAIFKDSWIGTMIFLILELIIFIYFIASYFPGGIEGANHFFKYVWEGIKGACKSCCNRSSSN